MEDVEQKINEIKDLILTLKVDSPRLSRNEAKRFLKMGESKFKVLVFTGVIKERHDHFAGKYFLRHELLKVLEDESPLEKKRQIVRSRE